MADDAKRRKMSVFLLKDNFSDFKDFIDDSKFVTEYDFRDSTKINGKLFLGKSKKEPPSWVDFISGEIEKPLPKDLLNSSNRAVIIIKEDKTVYGVSFGYGQFLIKESQIVDNFGLKVVLNDVNPDKIKSVDVASLENLHKQSRIQNSIGAGREDFGIDVISDLMKSVAGIPSNKLLGNIISGRDNLTIAPKIELNELPNIIKEIDQIYKKETYKDNFSWIDDLKYVRSSSLINQLNLKLVNQLKKGSINKIRLVFPEIIDFELGAEFRFTKSGDSYPDLSIKEWISEISDLDGLTIQKLKLKRIFVYEMDSDNLIKSWPLFKCISCEIKIKNRFYALAEGKWYEVKQNLVDEVNMYTKEIKISTLSLIDHSIGDYEGVYNKDLANSNAKYSLQDTRNVYCENARSKIEPCDVLTEDGQFIHVKKRASSATLSHLFAQARISAVSFMGDETFRRGIRKNLAKEGKLKQSIIPIQTPSAVDYEIVLAFIDASPKSLLESIPFFSLLNLKQTSQFLTMIGFEFSIKKIISK